MRQERIHRQPRRRRERSCAQPLATVPRDPADSDLAALDELLERISTALRDADLVEAR